MKKLRAIDTNAVISKQQIVKDVKQNMVNHGYTIVEVDEKRPWGAFIKLANNEADLFVEEFFPGLSPTDARLGNDKAELSPKILIVSPHQRLSWQYHKQRSECWVFLTKGNYDKSKTDEEAGVQTANHGDVVQFSPLERHRLIGNDNSYSLVAEIWQHTDSNNLSDENDIVRVSDDYSR